MILKGSRRGNGGNLAAHLLNSRDNDHIEIHEVRGLMATDLHGAFTEIQAIAGGTRCKRYLFSLSLSPPQTADVSPQIFENAIDRIERELGLDGQPRAIVFHEKNGRRHAHCVWSRIDAEAMKAREQRNFKWKLTHLSRQLYLEHGWDLPRGLVRRGDADPTNFTLAEWQQAKRLGEDARALKGVFQECWSVSDSQEAFSAALEEKGFCLAKGDRRGFVAVDCFGNPYSLTRALGLNSKEIAGRIGSADELSPLATVREEMRSACTAELNDYLKSKTTDFEKDLSPLFDEREEIRARQRAERENFRRFQEKRLQAENKARAEKLPRGLKGIWARITGKYREIRAANEAEASRLKQRDRAERQLLIQEQLAKRQKLQQKLTKIRGEHIEKMEEIRANALRFLKFRTDGDLPDRKPVQKQSRKQKRHRGR